MTYIGASLQERLRSVFITLSLYAIKKCFGLTNIVVQAGFKWCRIIYTERTSYFINKRFIWGYFKKENDSVDIITLITFLLTTNKYFTYTGCSLNFVFFPSDFVVFLNSASSAAALVFYLPGVCTLYTHWHRGKTEKGRSPEYFKIFEKTQYLMSTLYLRMYISVYAVALEIYIQKKD